MDIAVIVEGLAARAEELCRQILPNGRREGREWCVGSVDGEPGQSCKVRLDGARRGVWCDFASGEAGDALDLVAACLHRGDKRQALGWARAWLGYDGDDANALSRTKRAVAEAAKAPEPAADDARKRRIAKAIWLEARPSLKGTPAERYLLGRGIDLCVLGRQPRSLRYHPSLWHEPSGRRWPGIVACVVNGAGEQVAVHRTYLEARPDGSVGKAPVRYPKMTLGRIEGGSIRLWRGSSGKPLREAPAGSSAVIMEGIEDGLVLAMARPERRYLAAVAISNLGTVELPAAIGQVVLYLDNDPGNKQAAKGVERAILLHREAGREVLIARPPATHKDANDLLLDRRWEVA